MNYMSTSQIRQKAREALSGKWGKAACITLAYVAFGFILGFVCGLLGGIGEIISAIVQVPITFGITYAFIKLKRNEEVEAFQFVDLGFSNFGRAWKIGLRAVLKLIKPLIFLVICIAVILGASIGIATYATSAEINGSSIGMEILGYLGVVLIAFVGYIIGLIWLAISSLLYALTSFIAYDNPNMTALEVVNESKKMMNGNRGKLFILELSFIGWAILAVLTLGIGYIWLLPYMLVAEVCFYEYLLEKDKNNNSSNDNEEAIKEM